MFHAMVRFTLILLLQLRMLAIEVNHKWDACPSKAVPKHRSTHIPNYQSTEHESYECDENQLDNIPMCPRERFSLYKSLSRLVLCYKKDCATLLHFIYICYLLLVTNYPITKLSVTTNFSTCRKYLAGNRLSFPSAPRWVLHSYLSKGLRQIPYTCGSSIRNYKRSIKVNLTIA